MDTIEDIHDFWFGELNDSGLCATNRNGLWFGADEQTDEACRIRFGESLQQALAGELDEWMTRASGLVALVVLLDQFSRNIHRGTAQAFAGDARALAVTREAIAHGRHLGLPAIHRVFLYLPLEHSEELSAQEECVNLFEDLAAANSHQQIAEFTRYAIAHRDVIATFGRFPHRNKALGRESSAEEKAYLEQHGGF